MKFKFLPSTVLSCAAGACIATQADAATYFNDPLTSDTGNFAAGTGSGAVNFGSGGVGFDGAGDGGRRYVATTSSTTVTGNYFDVAFTASMTFIVPSTATGATTMYLGIGSGDVGTSYSQPDQGLAGVSGAWVGWDIRDLSGTSGRIVAKEINNGSASNILASGETAFTVGSPAYGPSDTTEHVTTMTWNPGNNQITWTLDIGNNGTVDETVTTTLSAGIVDRWTQDGHESRIFLGGNNGVTVSGFTLVPEPSVALLGGLGVLGLLRRRRA